MSNKNWETKKLEDLLEYIQPTKYIVKSTEYNDNYKTPVLTAGKTFILGKTNETEGIFENVPVIIFDDFTTANKLVNFKFKVKSSAMKILKPKNEDVNLLFVYYYMQTLRVSFDTHKRYWISVFSKLPIPLPNTETQHIIVSKIEELFSELDQGIADLKTAQAQLKVYRQSVLKHAFEGKLTNKNVKEGELPEGWEVDELKDVCVVKRGKSKHRPRNAPELYGGNYPFIQTGDIRNANGGYIKKYSQTYSEIGLQQSKLWPKGTLCITIAANIGETAILDFDACFPDSVVGLLTDEKVLYNKFLNYFFISFKQKLEELAPATAQKNINVNILENIKLPITSLEEQHQIVQEIESRLSVADKMEESIQESLQKAEALRQSILKKAFSGELV
ncbi:restriction endonuclease subunit S [Flavobacterium sp. 20NA77.7]|uniref:Restriction endonuclease subunit S n=1 Tax=Flavobacterium nakdongensis TaxID=3073563 RepID=A0ABY9R823_9FLAO|nr:restriction endonuclease subunit S [Flavobacterium sp. 20NA77.7]WMW77309.1 restriction endonuclease subunit S [Flavobacterium sp. 20NA77.7]